MTTPEELSLVDTNVLVYAADSAAELHIPARLRRDEGFQGQVSLAVSLQILMEFFAVITSPRRVARPCSAQEAAGESAKYMTTARVRKIYPGEDILERMLTLLEQYPRVARQEVFNLHLVATMLSNGISRIYTFNERHFRMFEDIEVIVPS